MTITVSGTNGYADAMGDAYHRLHGLGYERGANDFANHGPMAAEALCTMGFGEQVSAWIDRYTRRVAHHDPPQPGLRIDSSDEGSWRDALGQFHRAGDWEELFGRELAEEPWQAVLSRWWPRLVPGLLAGLTHGLIRTAHAVRCLSATNAPHDLALGELSRGLAYWAARYWQVPEGPSGSIPGAPLNSLSGMTSTFAGVYLAHPEVAPVPLIHGVTAPAAMRLALGHVPAHLHAESVAVMGQAQGALLQMFTGGRHDDPHMIEHAAVPTWADLFERALASDDEHAIKFTEACHRENALQHDLRFSAAVAAALRRLSQR
ncbi:MAG: questin oxidase family protein [Mycobacterium sp.]|nr:questin oxidase family protein [Mycobacterium sp.]